MVVFKEFIEYLNTLESQDRFNLGITVPEFMDSIDDMVSMIKAQLKKRNLRIDSKVSTSVVREILTELMTGIWKPYFSEFEARLAHYLRMKENSSRNCREFHALNPSLKKQVVNAMDSSRFDTGHFSSGNSAHLLLNVPDSGLTISARTKEGETLLVDFKSILGKEVNGAEVKYVQGNPQRVALEMEGSTLHLGKAHKCQSTYISFFPYEETLENSKDNS